MESFAEALLAQKGLKVDGRKAEVETYAEKIVSHRNSIKQLEQEIEIFQNKIDSVDQDVEKSELMIEGTKTKFLSVYNIMVDTIKSDIESINKHL